MISILKPKLELLRQVAKTIRSLSLTNKNLHKHGHTDIRPVSESYYRYLFPILCLSLIRYQFFSVTTSHPIPSLLPMVYYPCFIVYSLALFHSFTVLSLSPSLSCPISLYLVLYLLQTLSPNSLRGNRTRDLGCEVPRSYHYTTPPPHHISIPNIISYHLYYTFTIKHYIISFILNIVQCTMYMISYITNTKHHFT